MPGSAAAIFLDGSAELRERHQQDTIQQLVTFQIADKGRHRLGQLVQQCAMVAQLIGVVIKAADPATTEFREEDPDTDIGADELGDRAESGGELERGIFGRVG